MTTEAKIEACPFCGEQPRGPQYVGEEDYGYQAIECVSRACADQSRFSGIHADTREEAITGWNARTRAAQDDDAELVGRMRALEAQHLSHIEAMAAAYGDDPEAFKRTSAIALGFRDFQAMLARIESGSSVPLVQALREAASRATRVSPTIEREDRADGEERYVVYGVPCGFPVAKFGDFNDAELFVKAASLSSIASPGGTKG